MVLDIKSAIPALDMLKISKVVLISGILTFLYIIELCIGGRTVYHAFRQWNNPTFGLPENATVSWTLCVACLLVATVASFMISFISAMWEQKEIKEAGGEKNALRFAGHLMAGGIVWRYVMLWFCDCKTTQMKQNLLLTMTKFLHTQFFTIPLVIVHASLLENLEEMLYVVCSIVCISLNLILTCVMFSSCKSVVGDLKKWNYETVDLVPLIFTQNGANDEQSSPDKSPKSSKSDEETEDHSKDNSVLNKNIELTLVRSAVFCQTFCFSLGRLLALGILLKMAGIYAVSIMFLQLLVSVIYLKFQVPMLVSDTLQKWRQLTRFAFMSYILIFEWHLNRDTTTGYDINSKVKHPIIYYSIATLESAFYLVTWAITESYYSNQASEGLQKNQNKFIKYVILIGILSLLISLLAHLLILLWQSRRISTFMSSIKRRYASSKLRISLKRGKSAETNENLPKKSKLDISHPIPLDNSGLEDYGQTKESELEKHNSYQDLREPLDEDIEIYSKENERKSNEKSKESFEKVVTINSKECETVEKSSPKVVKEQLVKSARFKSNFVFKNVNLGVVNSVKNDETNNNKMVSNSNDKVKPRPKTPNSSVRSLDNEKPNTKVKSIEKTQEGEDSSGKSKVVILSNRFVNQWNKFSSVSQKFTGNVSERIQNCKKQFDAFRSGSSTTENKKDKSKSSNVDDEPPKQFIGEIYSTEGYFVGDERCHEISRPVSDISNSETEKEVSECLRIEQGEEYDVVEPLQTVSDVVDYDAIMPEDDPEPPPCDENENGTEVNHCDNDEGDDDVEPAHCDGIENCPCFVCRTGDGRLHRRRSSSVPPVARKQYFKSESSSLDGTMTRYPSSPNIVSNDLETGQQHNSGNESIDNRFPSPYISPKKLFYNLSLVSSDDREEHFV